MAPESLTAPPEFAPPTRRAVWIAVAALGSLLFIAVFPSVLSYLLWNHALTAVPPGRAGCSPT